MVRRKRKTRRRRKSMRGGHFQVGTIVKWKRNAETRAANEEDYQWDANNPSPNAVLRAEREAKSAAIREEEGWRGQIVTRPAMLMAPGGHGGAGGIMQRGINGELLQWVQTIWDGTPANSPPLGGWWPLEILNSYIPAPPAKHVNM